LGKILKMQDFRGLSRQLWHQRYVEQAQWTQHIRQYIFKKIETVPGERILEIGSGTSAVLNTLLREGYFNLSGIDIDFPSLLFSKSSRDPVYLAQANGMRLPFTAGTFGVSFCHFLLIWVNGPLQILEEMRRVTHSEGWVIALAEPDHQARIDYPQALDELGKSQTQALGKQGIDVYMGRKLRSLFYQAGLVDVEVGILGAQWNEQFDQKADQTEWAMIKADLGGELTTDDLTQYHNLDRQARQTGERILFIPTFYAFGKVI
jgi:SAM-dependent methyltransferase